MSAIALNDRDFNLMADGDPGVWMAVVGGIAAFSALAGVAATWLFRSRDTAKQDGQSLGKIETLIAESRAANQAWITESKVQAREMELRLSVRIASLELHRDNTATKEDLKNAVSDIKERLTDLVSEVRENRAVVQHRIIPPT